MYKKNSDIEKGCTKPSAPLEFDDKACGTVMSWFAILVVAVAVVCFTVVGIVNGVRESHYNDWIMAWQGNGTVQELDKDNYIMGPIYTNLRVKQYERERWRNDPVEYDYEYSFVTDTPRDAHMLWPRKERGVLAPGEYTMYENDLFHHKYYRVIIN